jgi:hypothetical protein
MGALSVTDEMVSIRRKTRTAAQQCWGLKKVRETGGTGGLDVADGLRACCCVFVLDVFAKACNFVLAHLKVFYLV